MHARCCYTVFVCVCLCDRAEQLAAAAAGLEERLSEATAAQQRQLADAEAAGRAELAAAVDGVQAEAGRAVETQVRQRSKALFSLPFLVLLSLPFLAVPLRLHRTVAISATGTPGPGRRWSAGSRPRSELPAAVP
eukprot:SAG22_NODE_1064_length_5756_cov_48.259502_5_plen_135_part_00